MNAIHSLLGKKDYSFFNEKGQLSTTSLNIFQRFFRVLGFYKNTRLEVVGAIAYEACFKSKTWSNDEKKTILNIVDKYTRPTHFFPLPSSLRYCDLGNEILSTGETVNYGGYIRKDGYSFKIKLIINKTTLRESSLKIFKTSNNTFNIVTIGENQIHPTMAGSFMANTDDVLTRVTLLFLSKIVNDSHHLHSLQIAHNGTTADIAQSYGFSCKIDPSAHLELDKIAAVKYAAHCHLKTPVSVDFLLS